MKRVLSLTVVPFLLLNACSGDTKESDTASATCPVTIKETLPAEGADDFYYMSPIEFHLSEADATAVASSDIPGTSTVSDDGTVVFYTPTSPLEPKTSYSVTLDYCGGSAEITFTTSELGGAVDAASLVGNTYNLDITKARITEPPNIGSVLSSLLTVSILVGVESYSDPDLTLLGAIAGEGTTTQDFCTQTIDFPVADFSGAPTFQVGPQDTVITVSGAGIPINDLNVTGTFAPDGSYFGGGTLSGSLDARDIATALADSLGQSADELCSLIAGVGASCGACPDGQNYCLNLVADSIVATKVDGTLIPVAASDCPGCDMGEPVCQ